MPEMFIKRLRTLSDSNFSNSTRLMVKEKLVVKEERHLLLFISTRCS